jgi:hypothetical protein
MQLPARCRHRPRARSATWCGYRPAWQGAIEAYLRSNVEALLIPADKDEERAVKLYRACPAGVRCMA